MLRNSKKGWEGAVLAFPVFILISLVFSFPGTGQAKERAQMLTYGVYAGGLHVVEATLELRLDEKNRYDIVLKAKTRGFLAGLIPWKGVFESHGWVLDKNRFQPEMHKSTTGWRDEVDIKEYLYHKDGRFKSLKITDEYSEGEHRDVDEELTDQTIDVLSTTFQVLHDYNTTQKCEGEAEVFDGKRRFKQSFHHEGEAVFSASKYNIFDGAVAECIVEVTPIAGAWHKKPRGWLSIQEQGRSRGTMPTVWIGKIDEAGETNIDAQDMPALPVKLQIKTAYGTLLMHLKGYDNK